MKKTLISILSTSIIAGSGCDVGTMYLLKTEPIIEVVDKKIRDLNSKNNNFDYDYETKITYKNASKYYLNKALENYEIIKNVIDTTVKTPPKYFGDVDEVLLKQMDFYFKEVVWYANEAQWDLVRIDEIENNYNYEIFVQNDWSIGIPENIPKENLNNSREWFKKRSEVMSNFLSFYYGTNKEIKYLDNREGIYMGGMKKALDLYKLLKGLQIVKYRSINRDTKLLENDWNFILDLQSFWTKRTKGIELAAHTTLSESWQKHS